MSTLKLKVLLLSAVAVQAAFADSSDESASSAFHQQNPDSSYIQPQPESNYFAMLAKTPAKLRGYVGLDVGIDMSNIKPTITFASFAETVGSNSLRNSLAGDIYGGVGTNFSNFYIGAELSAGGNFLNRKFITKTFVNNAQITVQKPLALGLDLLPGFLSPEQNFLFYGRMGLGGNWFNIKIANENANWSKLALAWRLGAGMEYFMSESISLRLDYIFSANSDITKNFTDSMAGASFYKIPSLYDHKVTLGLTFNF